MGNETAPQSSQQPGRKKSTPAEVIVLIVVLAVCGYYFYARNSATNPPTPTAQHKTLISFGLQFVSCQPDGKAAAAYKCLVRAPEVMEVNETCAYFDAEHHLLGSPKDVDDLRGVRLLAGESRKVTVYTFDEEIATVQCNAIDENYRYDQMVTLLGQLKPAGKAWQIDI